MWVESGFMVSQTVNTVYEPNSIMNVYSSKKPGLQLCTPDAQETHQ